MSALTCNVGGLLKRNCLVECDADTDIESFDVRNWALANGYDITADDTLKNLLSLSACLTCLTDKQMKSVENYVENNKFDTTGLTHATSFAQIKQVRQLTSKQRKALRIYLKCLYWNSH